MATEPVLKSPSLKEPTKQLDVQLNLLHDMLAKLDSRLLTLSNALTPVLRDEDTEKCTEGEPADKLVARAESVRSARWKAEHLVDRVEDIIERLEV